MIHANNTYKFVNCSIIVGSLRIQQSTFTGYVIILAPLLSYSDLSLKFLMTDITIVLLLFMMAILEDWVDESVLATVACFACTDAAYCYTCRTFRGLYVCLQGTPVNPAKTDEPIDLPFGKQTRVESRNHVLDRNQPLHWNGYFWETCIHPLKRSAIPMKSVGGMLISLS